MWEGGAGHEVSALLLEAVEARFGAKITWVDRV
jgi:hypothetical protein